MKTLVALAVVLLGIVRSQAVMSLDVQFVQDNWYCSFAMQPVDVPPDFYAISHWFDGAYIGGGVGDGLTVSGGGVVGTKPWLTVGDHELTWYYSTTDGGVFGPLPGLSYTITEPQGPAPGDLPVVPEASTAVAAMCLLLPFAFTLLRRR